MAFNPFANFRKYPKIWMASVLLLCMVTFVFCTGIGQGGLDDLIIKAIGGGRGAPVATVDGRSVYRDQIDQLKRQRSLANDFMRKAVEISIENIKKLVKDNSKPLQDKERESERQHYVTNWLGLKADFDERLKKPRYFEGGTKQQDLLDFILWQREADRRGIYLVDDAVDLEVRQELVPSLTRWDNRAAFAALDRVREQQHYGVRMEDVRAALREEFRVRIVKLVLMGSHPEFMQEPGLLPYDYPLQYRMPLSPDQLWLFYKDNLTQLDFGLLPVRAEHFKAKVPTPTDAQLESLFTKYRDKPYDPGTDSPGFISPERIQVSYLLFDSKAKHYQDAAKVALLLQKTPPIFFDAGQPVLGTALRYAVGPTAWETSMDQYYEQLRHQEYIKMLTAAQQGIEAVSRYYLPPLLSPHFALSLYNGIHEPKPTAVASLIAAADLPGLFSAAPALYQAEVVIRQEKEIAPHIEAQVKKRLPAGIQVLGAGFTGIPVAPAFLASALNREEQHLPLALVEEKIIEIPRERLASEWAVENLEAVRRQLELDTGIEPGFRARLKALEAEHGNAMKLHSTGDYRTTYDILQDPALAPFLKQFDRYRVQVNTIEGRSGTERELKEDDFARLFFDTGEKFSSAGGSYQVRVWPPTVTLPKGALRRSQERDPVKELLQMVGDDSEASARTEDLWKASDTPILFWKTKYEPARMPARLADAKTRVEEAFKLQEARSVALKTAEGLAQELRKKLEDPRTPPRAFLEAEAARLNEKLLVLDHVSPLVKHTLGGGGFGGGSVEYKPYTLPRGFIPYPRKDTVKDLLALRTLNSPLKTEGARSQPGDDTALDKINRTLFDPKAASRKVPQVQILTNQPRTIYYVAVILNEQEPRQEMFQMSYLLSRGQRGMGGLPHMSRDMLVTDAQKAAGDAYRQAFIQHLRDTYLRDVSKEGEHDTD